MADKMIDAGSFNWWLPLCVGFIALFISILIAVCQADTALLLSLIFGVILIVFSIALLVYTAFAEGRQKWLTLLAALSTVWGVSALVFVNQGQIRTKARWLVWSRNYKDRVLVQKAPTNGEFQHLQWDSWGWGEKHRRLSRFRPEGFAFRLRAQFVNKASSTAFPARFMK